jgi:hypothetical protein
MLVAMIAVTGACGKLSGVPSWPEGKRLDDDPVLLALLRPDIPDIRVASDGLYRTSSGQVFYEARLRDAPPRNYAKRYARLLDERAIRVRADASSPHAFPPRNFGWWTEVYRPGRRSPFSVFVTEFRDRDDEWLKSHWNAADPLQIAEGRWRFRLGRLVRPWTEHVIVPIEDVAPVLELPLPRFPGAILKKTYPIEDDAELLKDAMISRAYVVTGASFESVVAHYKAQGEKVGIQGATGGGDFFWSGDGPSALVQFGVTNSYVVVGGVGLLEVAGKWPHLMAGFPDQFIEYLVHARFKDAVTACAYRTETERKRRAALESQGAHPRP